MKNAIILKLIPILVLFFSSFCAFSAPEGENVVVIRIEESLTKADSWIKIIDNGESFAEHLNGWKYANDWAENLKTIESTLDKYIKQGYIVQSSNAFSFPSVAITNYILVK